MGKFKESFAPAIVLALICAVISGLLIFAYEMTYVDTTGVMTDELKEACEIVFGKADYEIKMTETVDENGETIKTPLVFDGVTSVILDGQGGCLLEISTKGYNKDGIHVVVGITSDGTVGGVSFVSIGETPGLGTNVNTPDYLAGFAGVSTAEEIAGLDNVTGATYSSKGLKTAVTLALETYAENKEAIFSE